MQLSAKALGINGSVTLEIDAKAKALRAEGKDVVGFGAGEPDFPTPRYISDAAKQAIDSDKTKYTPVAGIPELRAAIAAKLLADNGLAYTPESIVVSNGAKHSLINALMAVCNDGDEVIVPGPAWISYPEMIKLAGGVPVPVNATEAEDFKASAARIEAAVTPRTKAIIINSPSNPCGCIYSREELAAIADVCVRRGLFVISDEIYEKLIYDGNSHVSIASLGDEIKRQTIVINGVSKAYAMTGWRIGYAAAEEYIAKAMTRLQSQCTSNPNSVAQYAAYAALTHESGEMDMMLAEFSRRRDALCEALNAIPGISAPKPEGAFYVMMNISGAVGKKCDGRVIGGSLDFARMLLDKELVAVVPGMPFGSDSHVRLSYAVSMKDIIEGARRIGIFMAGLQD